MEEELETINLLVPRIWTLSDSFYTYEAFVQRIVLVVLFAYPIISKVTQSGDGIKEVRQVPR